MSQQDLEVVKAGYAALNRQDRDAYLAGLDPDAEWHVTGAVVGQQQVYRGREAIWEYFKSFADEFDEFRVEIGDVVDTGDSIIVVNRARGHGRASGAAVVLQFATVFTVRDGTVLRAENYADRKQALEAVRAREQE